jgi:hypothetical protein
MVYAVPNVDGKFTTKDGSVQIVVTRKQIVIQVNFPKEDVHIIEEQPTPPNTEDTVSKMDRLSRNMKAGFKLINDNLL